MPKSLGQIHTANLEFLIPNPAPVLGKWMLDAPQILSEQLQHLVRQGNYFKTVGIDMTVRSATANTQGGQLAGRILYYAPTKGRCAAYRDGFKAMATAFKGQGLNMRDNSQYDFRVMPGTNLQNAADIKQKATLNGVDSLTLAGSTPRSLFAVHNESVSPVQTAVPTFGSGFGVYGSSTDFVLDEGVLWSGNSDFAEDEFEEIPFTISWTPGADTAPVQFNWRPDPALYLAVMAGQYVFEFETVDFDDAPTGVVVEVAVHIAGWKSIMGDPNRRRPSKKTSTNAATAAKK